MKITSAEFIKSAFAPEHYPTDDRLEIAFLGRSNVGKSSLLNSLLQRKGLARTSNTPGRTQSINFFLVNDSFYFVDLPGYGYARVSKAMRSDWGQMAEQYLSSRPQLALLIQLVDARHEPSALDLQLNDWILHHRAPRLVVATKSDKLGANDLRKSIKTIGEKLEAPDLLAYSAEKGTGRDAVLARISAALKAR
jgi:GTP-binding protein